MMINKNQADFNILATQFDADWQQK